MVRRVAKIGAMVPEHAYCSRIHSLQTLDRRRLHGTRSLQVHLRFRRKPFEELMVTTPHVSQRLLEMALDELRGGILDTLESLE